MTPVASPWASRSSSARWRPRHHRRVITKTSDRHDEDGDADRVGDAVETDVQAGGEDVVAAGGPQQPVGRDHRGHERRAGGRVARPLQHVVLALVAGDPRLEERPRHHEQERRQRQHLSGQQDVPGDGVAREVGLPAGEDPQQALGDAHVPVGLGPGGDLRGVVGPVLPDRVDGQQPTHQRQGAEHHEEEARRLGEVDREERVADDVLARCARARPTGCACGRRSGAGAQRPGPAADPGSAARARCRAAEWRWLPGNSPPNARKER